MNTEEPNFEEIFAPKAPIEDPHEVASQGKRFYSEREMSLSRSKKKPEMLNAVFRQMVAELASAVFPEILNNEKAVSFILAAQPMKNQLHLRLEALVRPIEEAHEFPLRFTAPEEDAEV